MIALFKDALGYTYLGNWQDRANNRNVERELVIGWLEGQGHSRKIIDKVLFELGKVAALGGSKTLYDVNREVYSLLRYGVKVQPDVGEHTDTIWLIDWKNPDNNDFAIAEEMTVTAENTRRPDIVLYVNGIALGVLELKRSTVSVTEGIRQNLDSQKNEPEDTAMNKVEQFEREVKKRFVDEPGRMKLLIVVDKLLTGFDAPSAT